MHEAATPDRCADEPSRAWWQSIPLDLIVSVAAIILAGGLSLASIIP